jgi:hypothetical protein
MVEQRPLPLPTPFFEKKEAWATPEEWHVYRTKAPLPTRAADQRKTFFTIQIINHQSSNHQ